MGGLSGGSGWKYTHLSGAGTTTILTGIGASQGSATEPANLGLLAGVWVNTAGTSVTVYDSASGGGQVLAAWGATTGLMEPSGPIQLTTGLTVVIVGSADVTLAWG
jgi:hypothetical protein